MRRRDRRGKDKYRKDKKMGGKGGGIEKRMGIESMNKGNKRKEIYKMGAGKGKRERERMNKRDETMNDKVMGRGMGIDGKDE